LRNYSTKRHVAPARATVTDPTQALMTKAAVVNRAPVMSAWATVVCERMGFKREEALSIASAYTEMNAISKGVAIGVFEQSMGKGVELERGETQPYVDLMGRRIPLYRTRDEQWRGLVKGKPVEPAAAFGYIKRAFRQTAPHAVGAMRLLAETFGANELNRKGFGIYAEFRPQADKWGGRSEMKMSSILSLRKAGSASKDGKEQPVIQHAASDAVMDDVLPEGLEKEDVLENVDSPQKRPRTVTEGNIQQSADSAAPLDDAPDVP